MTPTTEQLKDLLAKVTPGEWEWQPHDYSMASLGVGDSPGYGTPLVMTAQACKGCTDRRTDDEWRWGRCGAPSEPDATLIALAPTLAAEVVRLREALGMIEAINTASNAMQANTTAWNARRPRF